MNAAAFSQNLQTNKDSVKVAVKDLDKAVFKMIEGKECKEKLQASKSALATCDEVKTELKQVNDVLKVDLSYLKQINANLEQNVVDLKKVAENEKNRGIRRGFFGFLKGVGVTSALIGGFLLFR